MPMEDLTTRVAAAYDAACSDTQDPVRGEGGGFLVNDSLAGGFVPDADFYQEEGISQDMKVSALPRALESLGLNSSQRQDV